MKKKREGFYFCLRCKKGRTDIFSLPCDKCLNSKKYKEEIAEFNKNWKGSFVQMHREVTALLIDKKTGQPVWVDKKGKKIPYGDSSVRYDLQTDPRGWRATGQKVRESDKYGNRM